MSAWRLVCDRCGLSREFGPETGGCPACARDGATGVLTACFEPAAPPPWPDAGRGLDRFRALLPVGDGFVSLGAGDTPLVPSRHIGPALGLERLWFKLEASNPTASFKDRYCAVSVDVARRAGSRGVVVSSTGNLGVSVAAYAAAAGLECLLVALDDIPAPMLGQALRHGATVVTTTRAARQDVFERIARRGDWFPVGLLLPRAVQNPFGVEGYRTMAWEMIDALGRAPDAVLFPCARGNGLYGAWKGFREARAWGWCDSAPRMVACQPEGANSIEVSIAREAPAAVELAPVESVAGSASESVSDDRAIRAVRESGGVGASVDDTTLVRAVAALGREGLGVEPSSALPVACLDSLVARGALHTDDLVVCVLTATGSRWPEYLPVDRHAIPHVERADGSVDRAVEGLLGR